jgi:general secretion pathway protein I
MPSETTTVSSHRFKPTQSDSGFALVEVLAAFAILSLTLIILFRTIGDGARNMRYVSTKIEALHIAQSKLALAGHELLLQPGTIHGEAAEGYRWMMHITPYQQDGTAESSALRGYWVEVTVSHGADGPQNGPKVTLRTLKLGSAQ